MSRTRIWLLRKKIPSPVGVVSVLPYIPIYAQNATRQIRLIGSPEASRTSAGQVGLLISLAGHSRFEISWLRAGLFAVLSIGCRKSIKFDSGDWSMYASDCEIHPHPGPVSLPLESTPEMY